MTSSFANESKLGFVRSVSLAFGSHAAELYGQMRPHSFIFLFFCFFHFVFHFFVFPWLSSWYSIATFLSNPFLFLIFFFFFFHSSWTFRDLSVMQKLLQRSHTPSVIAIITGIMDVIRILSKLRYLSLWNDNLIFRSMFLNDKLVH